MLDSTVSFSPESQAKLLELAENLGEPISVVLEQAIDHYQRHIFLEQTSRAFAGLRNNL